MKILYISHEEFLKHQMTPGHPESPARLTAIEDALKAGGLWEQLEHVQAVEAEVEQIRRVHDPAYIDFIVEQAAEASVAGLVPLDPDTFMNRHTLPAALRAAGAAAQAVDALLRGDAGAAFCAVRPPGHHAERRQAMGFCFFNNVAVGAAHALEAHGLRRVAIVDFDVHHGNGTQDIFKDDARVLFCSTHLHPFYPYTGDRLDGGNIVNTPLPMGAGGRRFRQAIDDDWLPHLHDFKPDMIFISAGFDAHRLDPLGGLALVEEDYYWVTQRLIEVAKQYCSGRIVSTLEGGYNLSVLGTSVAAHLRAFLDEN